MLSLAIILLTIIIILLVIILNKMRLYYNEIIYRFYSTNNIIKNHTNTIDNVYLQTNDIAHTNDNINRLVKVIIGKIDKISYILLNKSKVKNPSNNKDKRTTQPKIAQINDASSNSRLNN